MSFVIRLIAATVLFGGILAQSASAVRIDDSYNSIGLTVYAGSPEKNIGYADEINIHIMQRLEKWDQDGTIDGASVDLEYGLTEAYGKKIHLYSSPLGGISIYHESWARLQPAGLQPDTTYHARVVASNKDEAIYSNHVTFTTLAPKSAKPPVTSPPPPATNPPPPATNPPPPATNLLPGVANKPPVEQVSEVGGGKATAPESKSAEGGGGTQVTGPPVINVEVKLNVTIELKVGVKVRKLGGGRTQVTGTIQKALPHGEAYLEQMVGTGKWKLVQRTPIKATSSNRFSYRFRALKSSNRTRKYRVFVLPRKGGPAMSGQSRTFSIPARR